VKEQLATYIESYIKNPRMDEIPAILDIFQIKKFQKGDLFKSPFKPIDKIGFLINGSVRVFILKENGDWEEATVTLNGIEIAAQPTPHRERIEQCGNRGIR